MALTTSAASRKPICSFGASPMAGRPRPLNCSAASIMPGSTSWMGLKCLKSSAVSGLTSPSLFVNGRFGIKSLLSFVGLSETDDPAGLSAHHVTDRVKPPEHRREGNTALLAIHEPVVYGDNRLPPLQLGDKLERQPSFSVVLRALDRIEFKLHRIL